MDFSRSWNSAAKSAPVELLRNVSYECLNAVCAKWTAICFMWRLGLSAEVQQKPEAAAVLMGMFEAITQEAGVQQFTICLRSILQAAAVAELPPLAVPPDGLLRRMIATAWDAKLLLWSFYATHKLTEMQTKRRDVCATIGDAMDAVKFGKFDDPAAHIATDASYR
jgi:hypothetical protein